MKFEGEYDFDKANEEFKEVLEKLQVRFSTVVFKIGFFKVAF